MKTKAPSGESRTADVHASATLPWWCQ